MNLKKQKPLESLISKGCGAPRGIRTHNPRLTSGWNSLKAVVRNGGGNAGKWPFFNVGKNGEILLCREVIGHGLGTMEIVGVPSHADES